jgi:hypothetical protein
VRRREESIERGKVAKEDSTNLGEGVDHPLVAVGSSGGVVRVGENVEREGEWWRRVK